MKSFAFVVLFALSAFSLFSQTQDIDVYEKKEGDKILVMARNTGKVDYNVKVKITSTGMDVTPSANVEAVVPAGMMKQMATIAPRAGESWSYGFDVSYTQIMGSAKPSSPATPPPPPPMKEPQRPNQEKVSEPSSSLSSANVILYSKPGCGRCDFAKKQMSSQGIEFVEISTKSDSPEVNNMWTQMRNQGFNGGSITMPVIRVDGKYHYDIGDLNGFISKIKS